MKTITEIHDLIHSGVGEHLALEICEALLDHVYALKKDITLICGLERAGKPKTLRDEFAGRALMGVLASGGTDEHGNLSWSTLAKYAYIIADEMIAERSRHFLENAMSEIHAREATHRIAFAPECYNCGQPPHAPVHDPKYGSHLFVTPHEFIEACATCRDTFNNGPHTIIKIKEQALTRDNRAFCVFLPSGKCFLCTNPKDASVHTQPAKE